MRTGVMTEQAEVAITRIQEEYSEELMNKAHVIGVAMGLRQRNEVKTNELCLVVLVDQKVSVDQLDPLDRIPAQIDGVPVDVREMGAFNAL